LSRTGTAGLQIENGGGKIIKRRKSLKKLLSLLLRMLRPRLCGYVGGSETLPPPMSKEEEAEYLSRLAAGDERARQQLIVRNLRLVVYIAKRFENTAKHRGPGFDRRHRADKVRQHL
jgi:hypothetical protein